MGTDAFVLRYEAEGRIFTDLFLASPDFDVETLKNICRDLGLSITGNRTELIGRIAIASEGSVARRTIIQHLVSRKKGWVALKLGRISTLPDCLDPNDLVMSEGEQQWYGPISHPFDGDASWYIRPMFLPHWEVPEDSGQQPQKLAIRWLCFARIAEDIISLHWRGFTYADSLEGAQLRNSQFRYWEHVPKLFEEIGELMRAQTVPVNLHNLMIYKLWDQYRYDSEYEWIDRRIRAEAGGVSLSARAGAVVELSVGGIRHLATTIRSSVQRELETQHKMGLPDPERVDEVILRTLIREFGALSYEFSLQERAGNRVFRAHTYFGLKPNTSSPDSFPHLNLFTTWRDDLEQLQFLVDHLRADYDDKGQFEQRSLF
jgi:hypothetical protein